MGFRSPQGRKFFLRKTLEGKRKKAQITMQSLISSDLSCEPQGKTNLPGFLEGLYFEKRAEATVGKG